LLAEGYEVILVNSNPATIMTDPELATRTYIEPLTVDAVTAIIAQEAPDALLPTMGGQTALNLAFDLHRQGVLQAHNVTLIGANFAAITVAEDRDAFKQLMTSIGLDSLRSHVAETLEQAHSVAAELGFPLILRPAFTLGGSGGAVVFTPDEFDDKVSHALKLSPISQVLLEESALGWKEFELEVMRDCCDNVVIVCSVENVDPMGVHTGDSITVAPAQTLTDVEYQTLRDASQRIIRAVGVDAGGCNIQFAIHPQTGRVIVIEMNPRVSRSSALVSKATGVPIAKLSAKLAVGYTLDELPNDITRSTPACFEPALDYVVTKIPRFSFDKFPEGGQTLSPQMKSVGEVMAMGSTFQESFQKALRGLEISTPALLKTNQFIAKSVLEERLSTPNAERVFWLFQALHQGLPTQRIEELTGIDPWFVAAIAEIVAARSALKGRTLASLSYDELLRLKTMGLSDYQLSLLLGCAQAEVADRRQALGLMPVYKAVDTCAGEFEAETPYYYSTYWPGENEAPPPPTEGNKRVIILGGGPNRIGQGIEFDYCCVHAAQTLRALGYEAVMANSNPETVSTDYDTSTRLYFEPLTVEDVGNLLHQEQPMGVIAQLGGQTPLKLARALKDHPMMRPLGTSVDAIDAAEDRERFRAVLETTGLKSPESAIAFNPLQAIKVCEQIGYPIMIRPSYVLGGRAMRVVYSEASLRQYLDEVFSIEPDKPVLIDRFLEQAQELDVDAVSDGETTYVAAILEHIEHAGVHSGDSACVWPAQSLSPAMLTEVEEATKALAKALNVKGLLNIQFAVKNNELYVIEVNPRASRTVPFVCKASGVPLIQIAVRVMLGEPLQALLAELLPAELPQHLAVKLPVFPYIKFRESDPKPGPEMRSTGEVMGMDASFPLAYAKALAGAGFTLPKAGQVFMSVANQDKPEAVMLAQHLSRLGFSLLATAGTASYLQQHGLSVATVDKKHEGGHNAEILIQQGNIALVVNTPEGETALEDDSYIRKAAVLANVPMATTLTAGHAMAQAIEALTTQRFTYTCLQASY
jgi:carbamoyl-phosphate synthase large subunit